MAATSLSSLGLQYLQASPSKRRFLEENWDEIAKNILSQPKKEEQTSPNQDGLKVIARGECDFPLSLASAPTAPRALIMEGEIPAQKTFISIVGSRKADQAGRALAALFAEELAKRGVCIVSGLALGIDAAAHYGALKSGVRGATVAVLGSGHRQLYPAVHRGLARQIVENGGAILSQFLPDCGPRPWHFLARNKVVAALSKAIIIIQAPIHSGALSTARAAAEEGREVLVVPGDIDNPRYAGSHELIREGARLVASLNQIFVDLGIEDTKSTTAVDEPTSSDPLVALLLERGTLAISEIAHCFRENGEEAAIETKLLRLELEGKVLRLPGDYIRLAPRA